MVGSSVLAVFFVLLHLTDDLVHGELGGLTNIGATATVFLVVVWLGGIALSAKQRRGGYATILGLSAFGTVAALLHTTGVRASVTDIAQTSGIFFAWVVLAAGIFSLSALLLSGYALVLGGKPRAEE